MILLILLGIGFHLWTAKVAQSDAMEILKKTNWVSQMSAEDQQKVFEGVEKSSQPVRVVITHLIRLCGYYFVVSAMLFFIGNIIMGGEAKYAQMLGVLLYSDFIAVPQMLVVGLLATAKGTMNLALSLAAFFPADKAETFIYRFFNGFDIFSVWFIFVLIIGMASIYNFKSTKVAVWILPFWILWKVVFAMLAGFGFGF
jgi:hypothetical protein